VPRSAPDIVRVGRALRILGIITLGLGALAAAIRAYLYLVSIYHPTSFNPRAAQGVALVRDARRVMGGMLILLAAAGLTSRKEWGRRVARNTSLVSSLFGLSTVMLVIDGGGPGVAVIALCWLAGVSYVCFWLGRPDVKAQFEADSTEQEKRLMRRLAPLVLAVVGVVAVVTSNVEVRARALKASAKRPSAPAHPGSGYDGR